MKSMTGYGNSSGVVEGSTIEVIVKSVNGRYLEIRPHLPRRYLSLESEAIQLCKKQLQRGTVDFHIHVSQLAAQGEVTFRAEVAKKWLAQARKAFKELKIQPEFTAQDILAIPDFVQVGEAHVLTPKEAKTVLSVLEKAIGQCKSEREREGTKLQAICLNYVKDFRQLQSDISQDRVKYSQEIMVRMRSKLDKILQDRASEIQEERYLQEVALLVEKSDIEEELLRFAEHVKNVEKLLKSKGSDGKKLDFYAQELLREVNTIGSKSQYANITEKVVALKSKIEQFREQVQNIE